MAIEWCALYYDDDGEMDIGVDWQMTSTNTTVSIAPLIYRYDKYNTDNSGGSWDEYLINEPSGSQGGWTGLGWGSGSGERLIDSFNTRTYTKGSSAYTVTIRIYWYNTKVWRYNYGMYSIANGAHDFVITIPASGATSTVTFSSNGGDSPSFASKSCTYGQYYNLLPTCTRSGYKFTGWYTASSSGTRVYPITSVSKTSNHTLYARWQALSAPTITAVHRSGKVILTGTENESLVTFNNHKWEYSSNGTSGWTTLSGQTGLRAIHDVDNANYYYRLTSTADSCDSNASVMSSVVKASEGSYFDLFLPSTATNMYIKKTFTDIKFK